MKTININHIKYGILFTFVVFNSAFSQYIPILNYFDEIICVWAICMIFIYSINQKKGESFKIVGIVACLICLGLIGNFMFNFQNSKIAIIKDIVAFVKFPFVSIATMLMAKKRDFIFANRIAYKLSKIYLHIITVFAVISQYIDIGMRYDIRHGIQSYKFIFGHPTFLAYALVIMSAVIVSNGIKRNYIAVLESVILLVLTMRDKAFAYVLLLILLVFMIPNLKKIKWYHILIVGILALMVSYKKILEYTTYSWSPREALYVTMFKIFIDCFPVGSGFATFASSLSGKYYAETYYKYGDFSTRLGVNPTDYVNLGDAGFAYLAQFGIFGGLLYFILFYYIYKLIYNNSCRGPEQRKARYLLLGYSIIAMLVENFVCNESGATIALAMFLFV